MLDTSKVPALTIFQPGAERACVAGSTVIPGAPTVKTPITRGQILQRSSVELLARVIGPDGLPITPTNTASMSYVVIDKSTNATTASGSIDVSTAVCPILRIFPKWMEDDIGFNLTVNLDEDCFPNGDTTYRAEVRIVPTAGQVFIVAFDLQCLATYTATDD